MTPRAPRPRLFLDTCCWMEGIFQEYSLSHALITAARPFGFQLLLAKYVQAELEEAWEAKAAALIARGLGREVLGFQRRWTLLLRRVNPGSVRLPRLEEVARCRGHIRHQNDEPVLASILIARPSAVITANRRDFNDRVAAFAGVPIYSPKEYFTLVGDAFRRSALPHSQPL